MAHDERTAPLSTGATSIAAANLLGARMNVEVERRGATADRPRGFGDDGSGPNCVSVSTLM